MKMSFLFFSFAIDDVAVDDDDEDDSGCRMNAINILITAKTHLPNSLSLSLVLARSLFLSLSPPSLLMRIEGKISSSRYRLYMQREASRKTSLNTHKKNM
jgi:hypothetical protein